MTSKQQCQAASHVHPCVNLLQALPGGDESDFIMVGCAGIPQGSVDMSQHEKMIAAKRRGTLLLLRKGLA